MSLPILVVDDEPDVEVLTRQQFRRDPHVALPLITSKGLSGD